MEGGQKEKLQTRIRHGAKEVGRDAVRAIPAVILGTLLNVLDGVSYGMIIFPASGVFADLGAMGVTMFFVTAIVSQLIYSAGASGFAGVNGSMMIEVVPFFHILAQSIEDIILASGGPPEAIIATTLVAFALSSLLTGLTFLLLGVFKLGNLIGFFPRHILVGCIGGVGVFLFITGLTVSLRVSDDVPLNFDFLKLLFKDGASIALWAPALGLAILLRVLTHHWHGQLILPTYFIVIPAVFYVIVAAAHLDLPTLRREGWLFDVAVSSEPWYHFYSYFDFTQTHWGAIWATMPTQLALLFFNILHPPLNVPALAVSLDHDVDLNAELTAHGYSNLAAGVLGTPPNYIVYVNTLLFYKVGGDTRIAGFLLAAATTILLVVGTGPIAYIPVMVVGALIFVLGYDLAKEALWDTRGRVSKSEYATIVSIVIAMTVWDFVIGVLFGIVISCFFFVVQHSRRRSIRAIHTGTAVLSTVRRPSAHRAYLRAASSQTTVLRLQGFLFFGTIAGVEDTLRSLSHARFAVLDLTLVGGVDLSAAEALVRVHRFLQNAGVVLVLCGLNNADVRRALESVGLFEAGAELFDTLGDAVEWTENVYLRAWFARQKIEGVHAEAHAAVSARENGAHVDFGLAGSPRAEALGDAGRKTIALGLSNAHRVEAAVEVDAHAELFLTLAQALSEHGALDRARFAALPRYFTRHALPTGHALFAQGDEADALYVVQAGVLRATYAFAAPTTPVVENMVPGTLAGELSALCGGERNASVVVERDAVVWRLGVNELRRMEVEEHEMASEFMRLVLSAAKTDYDVLLAALATRM
ncbi:hypothetical protein PENSPDRAFT_578682 [Peniophora sp. CONT]|nr:hypothetical protein PENSPDRAFT_578682 [Peniophora sp. CONT]